ncbi:hypothetical protein KSAC_31170 (plasmid) [Komagataeibacter saccharivorans]|uniref:hypothetical protein n=1 Tax=Komagataeibacter saccharivorans TaxID=265959 RepID=UPI00104FC9E2|nr:hypothetical protein [Komagataeibacter saccharivorans]QBL95296.1 hypothetical protein KSAC_31170 [Komagataeibacter saccharivorans]
MIIILKSGDSPVTIVPGEGGVSIISEPDMTCGSAATAAALIRQRGTAVSQPAGRNVSVAHGKRRLGVGLCLLSFCLIGLAFGRGLLSGHASPSVPPAAPAHNVAGPQRHAEDLPFPPPAPGVPRTSDPAPSRPDTPATVNTPFGLQ